MLATTHTHNKRQLTPHHPQYDALAWTGLDAVSSEISRVRDYLTSLRRRWNQLLPIGRLPADVLIQIMGELVASQTLEHDIQKESNSHCESRCPNWTAFSLVCHEWRAIALSTPTLWTRLDSTVLGTPLALEMVRRSRELPLAVVAHGTLAIVSQGLQLATGICRERVRVLEVSDLPNGPDGFTLPEGTYNFEDLPHLEVFHMSTMRHPSTHIVLGHLPRIKRISVRGASFAWRDTASSLASLSTLSLSTIPASAEYGIEQLVELLARAPNLHALHLDHAIRVPPQFTPLSFEQSQKVDLPRLKRFSHEESAPEGCTALMARLRIPADVEIGHLIRGNWEVDTYHAFLRELGNHFSSPSWDKIELSAESTGGYVTIEASALGLVNAPFKLCMPFGFHQGYHPHMSAVLGGNARTVRELALFDESRIVPAVVHDTLRGMDNVAKLKTYIYTLFVLRYGLAGAPNASAETALLPALETIVLRPLPIGSQLTKFGVTRDKIDESEVEILRSVLESRRAIGKRVRSVHIEEFSHVDKKIHELATLGADIFVDGRKVTT